MRSTIKFLSAALLLSMATWSYAASPSQDCKGCSDNALLARYQGSILVGADQTAYDEGVFPTGPVTKSKAGAVLAPPTLTVAGKRTRLFYMVPASRSTFEVFANYREALGKAGMTVVWSCTNDQECGPGFIYQARMIMQLKLGNTMESTMGFILGEHPRYLLATLARPEGEVHVAVLTADIRDKQRPGVYVMQVEAKPMDKGMTETKQAAPVETPPIALQPSVPPVVSKPAVVESKPVAIESKPVVVDKPTAIKSKPGVTESKPVEPVAAPVNTAPVNAAALNSNLANTGQVTLYGIHFDFDKADIKAESKPQVDEIAKALTANPALKLRVIGYTDSKGTAEHNQKLSQHRADAIVAALVANYAIAANRLTAAGLGATAPVASNDTEEGRAKNRRVELLKQ